MIEMFYERTSAKDMAGVLELCTDDVTMRIPFDPVVSVREVVGKDALLATAQVLDWYDSYQQNVTGIQPMLDPEAWLATVEGDLFVRATQLAYRNDYLTLFRFRDGKIAEWTTYHDPIRQLIAFGATELPAAPA